MKKGLKIGIGVTVAAGAAAAIAVPIALNVSKKTKVIDKDINLNEKAWGNTTLGDLLNQVKQDIQVNGSLVTDLGKVATFYLYDKEQTGSIKLQKQWFEYKIWKLNKEKAATGTPDARKHEIEREINSINAKIAKLPNLTNSDYNRISFKTDYPKILMKRSIIKERQTNIYNDTKNAYIRQFATRAEGERAWIEERKKKYNGATSDSDAIALLVYKIIQNDAYARTKYSFNSSYTYEQKQSGKFTFLVNAVEPPTSPKDTDKVYFISTQSKDPDKIAVDISATSPDIVKLTGSKLVKTSHALIQAKQDEKGYSLPWKVSKDVLIGDSAGKSFGLLSFYGAGGSKNFFNLLTTLFTGATMSDDDKEFIHKATGQPSASKDGSLGVNTKIGSLKNMVPGFALGGIEGMTDHSTHDGAAIVTKIVTGLQKFLTDNSITDQVALEQHVNAMSDNEISATFGTLFRDAFKDGATTNAPKLSYGIGTNSYMVLSNNGIHFVMLQDFQNAADLSSQITKDLNNAAKNQSVKDNVIDYSKLFSIVSQQDIILKDLIKNDGAFMTILKDGYNLPSTSKTGEQFPDVYEADGTTKLPFDSASLGADTVLERIKKAFENIEATRVYKEVTGVLGNTLDDWLVKNYDSGLRTFTKSPTEIYQDAVTLGGTP